MEVPPVKPLPKKYFGLDERFLFFFMFDISSVMERKNPLGLFRAFRRAFPKGEAQLVVKATRGESFPEDTATLRKAAEKAEVTLIERLLPRDEVMGLMAACDCYVSLHRSEGVGLTMAEAMLMGKPVVATGYSGNLDFMNDDVSLLVDHRMVPLGRDIGPYPAEASWAEPSEEHAAELMRRVFEARDEATRMGERAREHAMSVLSLDAAAKRMATRVQEINEERRRR